MFGVCESILSDVISNENALINNFTLLEVIKLKPNRRSKSTNLRGDLETIPETIVAEVKLNRKKSFVLSYSHPNR